MTVKSCEECARLWRDYQNATTSHIHLCGKHRIAELQHDREKAAGILGLVQEAQRERDASRAAIQQHEADLHGAAPGSAGEICGEMV